VKVNVGESNDVTISAKAEGGDIISISVANLPRGAFVTTQDGILEIHWKPLAEDMGEHEITVTATNGEASASTPMSLIVVEEWGTFFMPGLGYSGYAPNGLEAYGPYAGVSAEFLLFAWIYHNNNRGPSNGRTYIDCDILWSSHARANTLFVPTIGLDLSIERNPIRHFLLPYYGLESGAIIQKGFDALGFFTPYLGVHAFASQNVFLNVTAGYVFPLDANRFDDFRGWRLKAGIDLSFW
jgi:hypothetical protein